MMKITQEILLYQNKIQKKDKIENMIDFKENEKNLEEIFYIIYVTYTPSRDKNVWFQRRLRKNEK